MRLTWYLPNSGHAFLAVVPVALWGERELPEAPLTIRVSENFSLAPGCSMAGVLFSVRKPLRVYRLAYLGPCPTFALLAPQTWCPAILASCFGNLRFARVCCNLPVSRLAHMDEDVGWERPHLSAFGESMAPHVLPSRRFPGACGHICLHHDCLNSPTQKARHSSTPIAYALNALQVPSQMSTCGQEFLAHRLMRA